MSTTLLGWLSWDADPTGNNCVPRDTDPYAWVCVGLGAGYIIIDVLLPLLLFMLFAYKYVFPTVGVVVGAAELATIEGGEVLKDAEKTAGAPPVPDLTIDSHIVDAQQTAPHAPLCGGSGRSRRGRGRR